MQYFRSSSTIAAALGIAGLAAPVQAQEALEEIVVTALKRAESLQDAPATVTAFDAETVEQARIQSMRDYVNLTSNMTLMETQNNAFAFVNIRGLAQIRNVDPTVAVVVDGVLSTTSLAFSQELYDIQQIEVLKGPQGALYGRNATGGAINITTKQPTTELRDLRARRLRQRRQRAAFRRRERPDRRRQRAAAASSSATRTRTAGATTSRRASKRTRTRTSRSPASCSGTSATSTTLDLRLTLSHTESTGSQFVSNAPNFVTGFPGNAQYPGNGTAPPVPGLPASITALVGDPNNTSIKHQGNEPGMDDREVLNLSAKFDWEVGAGTLTSITSLDSLDHVTAAEQFAYYPFVQVQGTTNPLHPAGVLVPPTAAALAAPGGTGQNLTFGQNRFHDSFSQELRFTSPDDQRLRWIGGVYFAQTDLDVMISINDDFGVGFVEQRTGPNIGGINPTVSWTARFLAPLIPLPGSACRVRSRCNPNTNPSALAYNFDSNHNTAYAAFGQINYDLSDTLELSAALRYDRDERELTIMAPDQFLPVFRVPERPPRRRARGRVRFRAAEGHAELAAERGLDRLRDLRGRLPQRRVQLERRRDRRRDARRCRRPGLAAGRARLVQPRGHRGLRGRLQVDARSAARCVGTPRCSTRRSRTASRSCSSRRSRRRRRATSRRPTSAALETSLSWLATERLAGRSRVSGFLDSEITASDWVGAGGISIIGKEMPQNPESTANLGLVYRGQLGGNREWYARLDYRRLGEVYLGAGELRRARSAVARRPAVRHHSSPRLGSRRLDRQRDGRGLDLRGVEPERHRVLRQAAAVRRRDDLPILSGGVREISLRRSSATPPRAFPSIDRRPAASGDKAELRSGTPTATGSQSLALTVMAATICGPAFSQDDPIAAIEARVSLSILVRGRAGENDLA